MAEWTRDINTSFNFPNINILNVYCDGVLKRYEAVPQDGYVMYDTTAQDFEYQIDPETGLPAKDPETGEEIQIPVTYYHLIIIMPLSFNFATNFVWAARLRSEIDENYILGGDDDDDHEVM